MKTLQEIAREYAMNYPSEQQNFVMDIFVAGYREGFKGKQREDWDLSFCLPEYKKIVFEWLVYKKERKEKYKSQKSIIAMYNKLLELSDNDCNIAYAIIQQSIANNWAGLFPLKYEKGNNIGKRTTIFDAAEQVLK